MKTRYTITIDTEAPDDAALRTVLSIALSQLAHHNMIRLLHDDFSIRAVADVDSAYGGVKVGRMDFTDAPADWSAEPTEEPAA